MSIVAYIDRIAVLEVQLATARQEIDGLSSLCKDYREERDRAEAACAALAAVLQKIYNWNEHDPLADCAMRQFAGEALKHPTPPPREQGDE